MKFRTSKPMFIKASDGRWDDMKQQIKKRGFADSELWDLGYVIASFILPRLKQFRKNLFGIPGYMTEKEWKNILDKMIFSFKELSKEDINISSGNDNKIKEGLHCFAEYFSHLWE